MDIDEKIADLCREFVKPELSDTADLEIRSSLNAELSTIASTYSRPIMTIDEIAEYLSVSVVDVETYLGDIPCFEFAGKLRFRRQAVDTWIEKKEHAFTSDMIYFKARDERKFFIV